MKKLFIRVTPKNKTERFFRCGFEFSKDWQAIEVDAATAARLAAEQMLDVSDVAPEEMATSAPVTTPPAGTSHFAPSRPEDKAVLLEEIAKAARELPQEVASNWKKGGSPTTEALGAVLGYTITAAERDAAWAVVMKEGREG